MAVLFGLVIRECQHREKLDVLLRSHPLDRPIYLEAGPTRRPFAQTIESGKLGGLLFLELALAHSYFLAREGHNPYVGFGRPV